MMDVIVEMYGNQFTTDDMLDAAKLDLHRIQS